MATDGGLAAFLEADRKRTSLRAMEARSRVPRTTLDTLIKRRNTRLPQYETLQKLAAAFRLALWKVAEMACSHTSRRASGSVSNGKDSVEPAKQAQGM